VDSKVDNVKRVSNADQSTFLNLPERFNDDKQLLICEFGDDLGASEELSRGDNYYRRDACESTDNWHRTWGRKDPGSGLENIDEQLAKSFQNAVGGPGILPPKMSRATHVESARRNSDPHLYVNVAYRHEDGYEERCMLDGTNFFHNGDLEVHKANEIGRPPGLGDGNKLHGSEQVDGFIQNSGGPDINVCEVNDDGSGADRTPVQESCETMFDGGTLKSNKDTKNCAGDASDTCENVQATQSSSGNHSMYSYDIGYLLINKY